MLKKTLYSIMRRRKFQTLWGWLHKMALLGMNIGSFGSVHESGEIRVLELVKRNLPMDRKGIVFDVGANVGKYTREIVSHFGGDVLVYCFEPSEKSFTKLTENVRVYENVKPYRFGFGEKEEAVMLYSNEECSGLASVYKRRLEHFGIAIKYNEEVMLKKLDDFCKEKNIIGINLLKLDVEGHEYPVLKGAGKLIASKRIDFIQFEFGGCNIDSRTYFQDFFYFLGPNYNIFRVVRDGLVPIETYREMYEIFITTNFLAVLKGIDMR